MSTPSLHGSFSPRPQDLDIRAATISIATAGAIVLAVIAAALVPGGAIYAVLAAAGVALGAASVIAQLRRRNAPQLYQWLSALGGLVILIIGLLNAVARIGSSPILAAASMISSYYLMPLAALACYIGGLGQLPIRWLGTTLLITGGAAAATWFSLGNDTSGTNIAISIAAFFSLIGCSYLLVQLRKIPEKNWAKWLILSASSLIALLMIHMIGLALLAQFLPWPWLHPGLVTWLYFISGALATSAGLLTSVKS